MTRFLKSLHGWLGVMILPWIVMAGFTGLVENHGYAILRHLPDTRFAPAMVAQLPPSPVDAARVTEMAARLLPQPFLPPSQARVLTRPGFSVIAQGRTLQVDQATGAYLLIGPYMSTLYDAKGWRIATQVQWPRLMNRLHRAGWASDSLGTWPADLAAGAMMLFGASGLWLFLAPRFRRWRNRRARGLDRA
jgi:hypothetical protein